MSIGMSVRISAISALLFAALLGKPAVARNYDTRTFGPERFGSELQPQSAPEWVQTSRLLVTKPSIRKQRALRRGRLIAIAHGRPAAIAAGYRPARREFQIARPPSSPAPRAAVPAEVAAVEAAAPARQIPETADPVVAGARFVAADQLNGVDRATVPPVQANGPSEAGPMPTPPAPSKTAALRAAMFVLGPVMVVGVLAWCVRRRAVDDPKGRRSAVADTEDFLRYENLMAVDPAEADVGLSPRPRVRYEGNGAIGTESDDVIDLQPSEYDVLSWPHVTPAGQAAFAGSK
jgi:hypothetical protein